MALAPLLRFLDNTTECFVNCKVFKKKGRGDHEMLPKCEISRLHSLGPDGLQEGRCGPGAADSPPTAQLTLRLVSIPRRREHRGTWACTPPGAAFAPFQPQLRPLGSLDHSPPVPWSPSQRALCTLPCSSAPCQTRRGTLSLWSWSREALCKWGQLGGGW